MTERDRGRGSCGTEMGRAKGTHSGQCACLAEWRRPQWPVAVGASWTQVLLAGCGALQQPWGRELADGALSSPAAFPALVPGPGSGRLWQQRADLGLRSWGKAAVGSEGQWPRGPSRGQARAGTQREGLRTARAPRPPGGDQRSSRCHGAGGGLSPCPDAWQWQVGGAGAGHRGDGGSGGQVLCHRRPQMRLRLEWGNLWPKPHPRQPGRT